MRDGSAKTARGAGARRRGDAGRAGAGNPLGDGASHPRVFGWTGGGMSRRDALKFIGGGAIGTMLTPLPWKLLDDIAIWTQNGSHVMHVPRGAVTTRTTHCTLCPAGCGLRVRCAGGRPVGITGVPQHPRSFGATCPLGLAAHHLSFHPHRATSALWRPTPDAPGRTISVAAAVEELGAWVAAAQQAGGSGAVAILDARPERSVSCLYRRWLAELGCGAYVLPSGHSSSALDGMLHEPIGALGVDLGRVRTVLSFGAPILAGWTAPGRVMWRRRAPDHGFTLIQAESRPSTTALQAERWLQPRPGSDTALAFGIAHVILAENLHIGTTISRTADDFDAYCDLVRGFTPEGVEALTGIEARDIRDTARCFARQGPAVALAGVDPGAGPVAPTTALAVWGLNLLVGAVTRDGAFAVRRPVPPPQDVAPTPELVARELGAVPDGSVHVLIVDANSASCILPWALLQRKLAPGGRVACLSAYAAGIAHRAHLLLPAPAPFEAWDEAPSPPDGAVASYAVGVPLRRARVDVIDATALVLRLGSRTTPGALPRPEALDTEMLLRQRAQAIASSGRGVIIDSDQGTGRPVADLTADACDTALRQGGCWLDDAAPSPRLPRLSLLGRDPARRAALLRGDWQCPPPPAAHPLVLVPFASSGAGLGVLPPVLAKLYRESDLLTRCGVAFVHPSTAAACGVEDGGWGSVETRHGRATLCMRTDAAVQPGVLHVAVGADGWAFGDGKCQSAEILALCEVTADGTWRTTPAALQPA